MSCFAQAEVLIPSKKLVAQRKLLEEGAFGRVTEVQARWSQVYFAMKLVKPVSASSVYTGLFSDAEQSTALLSIP